MQLPHIAARLYGTPLLINRSKLDVILSVLGNRIDWQEVQHLAKDANLSDSVMATSISNKEIPYNSPGIAIIPVQGTLVKRTLGLEASSGLTSYAEIQTRLGVAMRDPNVRGI